MDDIIGLAKCSEEGPPGKDKREGKGIDASGNVLEQVRRIVCS